MISKLRLIAIVLGVVGLGGCSKKADIWQIGDYTIKLHDAGTALSVSCKGKRDTTVDTSHLAVGQVVMKPILTDDQIFRETVGEGQKIQLLETYPREDGNSVVIAYVVELDTPNDWPLCVVKITDGKAFKSIATLMFDGAIAFRSTNLADPDAEKALRDALGPWEMTYAPSGVTTYVKRTDATR